MKREKLFKHFKLTKQFCIFVQVQKGISPPKYICFLICCTCVLNSFK
jgi:hypothetical protein